MRETGDMDPATAARRRGGREGGRELGEEMQGIMASIHVPEVLRMVAGRRR